MSNYIKIPLAANPGRPFVSGLTIAGTDLSDADPASPAVVDGGTAGGDSATATTSAASPASGATFTGATGSAGAPAGGLDDLTLTMTAAGDNYKVGDVVTVAAATTGSETEWSQAIKFTVTAAMLSAIEYTDSPFQMIPIEDIVSIESVLASGSIADNKLFISTKTRSGDTTNAHSEFAGWTVNFEDSDYNEANCIASISEAIAKADSAINSQPSVVFFAGAEVINVVYGKNPTTV